MTTIQVGDRVRRRKPKAGGPDYAGTVESDVWAQHRRGHFENFACVLWDNGRHSTLARDVLRHPTEVEQALEQIKDAEIHLKRIAGRDVTPAYKGSHLEDAEVALQCALKYVQAELGSTCTGC